MQANHYKHCAPPERENMCRYRWVSPTATVSRRYAAKRPIGTRNVFPTVSTKIFHPSFLLRTTQIIAPIIEFALHRPES
jgi:hypothetical protein